MIPEMPLIHISQPKIIFYLSYCAAKIQTIAHLINKCAIKAGNLTKKVIYLLIFNRKSPLVPLIDHIGDAKIEHSAIIYIIIYVSF